MSTVQTWEKIHKTLSAKEMTNISMDIKYMPNSENGYNYILLMLCEISNFIVTAPLFTAT